MKRLIAFTHGANDPAARFRIGQFTPYLRGAGWEVSLRARFPPHPWKTAWPGAAYACRRFKRRWDIRQAGDFDAVFLNRDLLEGKWLYESLLFERNPRVIFDFDDAIYLGEKAGHIARICERAAWIVAGNATLAEFARQHSDRVSVIPTVIDTDRYAARGGAGSRKVRVGSPTLRVGSPTVRVGSPTVRVGSPTVRVGSPTVRVGSPTVRVGSPTVRVGWMGSDQSIRETLFPHVEMLTDLQRKLGFEFVVVSGSRPPFPCRFVEWSAAVETTIAKLFDIGIMPLVDDAFQRGKCGCKLLQYMAAGLPVIASPVGINASLVDASRGMAAANEAEWEHALAVLAADASLRDRMGHAGRAFVEEHYSIRAWFPRWLAIIERVAAASGRSR